MSRAAHQLFDVPRVLEDPVALRLLGAQCVQDIRTHRWRFMGPGARRLRAFLVARSRIAEDELAAACARGVCQYVILGAGLDTSAWRNPCPRTALKVFEVDHPATQAWKRGRLDAAGIGVPDSLTFVPLDFETHSLAAALQTAGLRRDAPAFFSWLGVTMYLSREAVMSTLGYVGAGPRGCGIVFDYAVPPAALSAPRRLLYRALLRRVAEVGEPWQAFFAPATLRAALAALGFSHREDFGAADLNARFFPGRGHGLRVGGPGRVMSART